MPKPTEPDALSDTDFSSDSESTARLQKKGTTTTKSVENSKTTTPLKRLQKTKDKASTTIPIPSVADKAISKKPAFTTASSSPTRSLRRNPQPKKVIEVSTAPCYKRKKLDATPSVSSISRPSGEVTSPSSEVDFIVTTPKPIRIVPAVTDTSSKGYYDPLSGESPPGVDFVDSPLSPPTTPIETTTITSSELVSNTITLVSPTQVPIPQTLPTSSSKVTPRNLQALQSILPEHHLTNEDLEVLDEFCDTVNMSRQFLFMSSPPRLLLDSPETPSQGTAVVTSTSATATTGLLCISSLHQLLSMYYLKELCSDNYICYCFYWTAPTSTGIRCLNDL